MPLMPHTLGPNSCRLPRRAPKVCWHVLLMPGPCRRNDPRQIGNSWLPAEFCPGLGAIVDEHGWIAGSARAHHGRDLQPRYLPCGLDDLAHRGPLAEAKIVGAKACAPIQSFD